MGEKIEQGGKKATKNGSQLENFVKSILENKGYQFIERNKFMLAINGLEQKLYTQQFKVGESIYATKDHPHKIVVDFLVYNSNTKEKYSIIECKSQTSAGSVDEKYPYLNENIKHKYPHKTMVILDAPAAKRGAKLWLVEQEKTNAKLKIFEDFSAFRAWGMKNL